MEIITFSKLGKRPDLLSRMGIERKGLRHWMDFYADCDYVKTGRLPRWPNKEIKPSQVTWFTELMEVARDRGAEAFITIGYPCTPEVVYVFLATPSKAAIKLIEWFNGPDAQWHDKIHTWQHWKDKVETGVAYRGSKGYTYTLYPYKLK